MPDFIVETDNRHVSSKWVSVFYFIHFAYICRMELDRVKYWTNVSDYDLETAEAMYSTGRWLYVGFMCHQTLEKIFKAYWCSKTLHRLVG